MKFDTSPWVGRLRDDEALTDNLDDDQARRLLSWGEGQLDGATSDAEAERVLAAVREVNRRAGQGEEPGPLLAELERPKPEESDGAGTPEPVLLPGPAKAAEEAGSPESAPPGADTPSTDINQRPSSTS